MTSASPAAATVRSTGAASCTSTCSAVRVGVTGAAPRGVAAGRLADAGAEVADQVRLVAVAQVGRKGRPVDRPGLRAGGGLVQAGALQDPLGPHPDVGAEQPLQAPHADAQPRRHVLHPARPGVGGDGVDQPGEDLGHGVAAGQDGAQRVLQPGGARLAGARRQDAVRQVVAVEVEDLPGGHHLVGQRRHRRSGGPEERPEPAGPEAHRDDDPLALQGAGEPGPRDTDHVGARRLHRQVHRRVGQHLLHVRRPPAQVPGDAPQVLDERSQVGRRQPAAHGHAVGQPAQDPARLVGTGRQHRRRW